MPCINDPLSDGGIFDHAVLNSGLSWTKRLRRGIAGRSRLLQIHVGRSFPHPAANRFVPSAFLIGVAMRKALSIVRPTVAMNCYRCVRTLTPALSLREREPVCRAQRIRSRAIPRFRPASSYETWITVYLKPAPPCSIGDTCRLLSPRRSPGGSGIPARYRRKSATSLS
jgi:hypothetical protein